MAVVGGTKVTSCKQAAKLMKQSPEKFTVRIERLTNVKSQEQEIKFEEDNISIKVFFHLLDFISVVLSFQLFYSIPHNLSHV